MKLITWNIQRGRGPGRTCSLDRVVADLRQLADFDVLCLQEVSAGFSDMPGCDGSNQFVGLAQRLPEHTAVAGLAIDTLADGGGRKLFGNMLFSRYPVLQVFRHALPWPPGPEEMSMQRMALEATLDTPLGIVQVSSVHLEYFSAEQRAAQVERLRELHREAVLHARIGRRGGAQDGPLRAVARGAAALIAGDFNFLPGSADHGRMQAPFVDGIPAYRDAWQIAHPGEPHAPSVCVRDASPFTFDFVFASEDLATRVKRVEVGLEIDGPDHQPVLVELDQSHT
jgi:endonuclease/exonuclease/phosphatase family metal-dependent hydrolase